MIGLRRIATPLIGSFLFASCQANSLTGPTPDQAAGGRTDPTGSTGGAGGGGGGTGYYTVGVRVRCEVRSNRSKISVDGENLSPSGGTFSARVSSGSNQATAPAKKAIGDEAEFDFDSDQGDIAAGATAIAATFIVNKRVTGEILDAAGKVLVSATATCTEQ